MKVSQQTRLSTADRALLAWLQKRHAITARQLSDPDCIETRQYVEERLASLESRMAELEEAR